MTWEGLLALSRLLSGPRGIGLPLSHSLFFFTTNAVCHSSFSYFDGVSATPNPYAPQIREMITAGYVDTIHAYGDFDGGGFTRVHAEQVRAECERHDMKFLIFTNHGGSLNSQNIGCRGLAHDYWHGDDPRHESYHLDITTRLGVRYVWPDSVAAVNLPYENTPLLYREVARDGTEVTYFKRYRGLVGKAAPNIASLAEQMTRQDLDRLLADEVPCFYYQHFGVWTKNADGTFEANRAPWFTPEGLEVLEYLAELYHDKKCWVVPTLALLRFLDARDTVTHSVEGEHVILSDPTGRIGICDLAGLTFDLLSPRIRRLLWQDSRGVRTPLPTTHIVTGTGRSLLQVPWQPLEPFPW